MTLEQAKAKHLSDLEGDIERYGFRIPWSEKIDQEEAKALAVDSQGSGQESRNRLAEVEDGIKSTTLE